MNRLCWLLLASVLSAAGVVYSQDNSASTTKENGWVDISTKVLAGLASQGKKPDWPGKTAGIAVDRVTGDVYMVIPGRGIWRSRDHGKSFRRVDGGKIGGRCETGFALNLDPKGRRLACFMLDGPSGYTLDGGKTWAEMKGNGRGWDAGSVEWSAEEPVSIFALKHECGGEIYTSGDMGRSWKLKGKAFTSVGIFDAKTFVATQETERGIFRTEDGGENWQKVAELQSAGRDIRILNGVAYWASSAGLLASRDTGKTWAVQGTAVDCSFGPYFGKDEKHIVVVGKKGWFETRDCGTHWQWVAPLPPRFGVAMPGWFLNFGWDPNANIFYASRMGEPAYRYQRW
jgi:photosystem II stability/assembly factor-like uncharacterized protein